MANSNILSAATTAAPVTHLGLREVLGEPAWQRLPTAVRTRFAEPVLAVDYVGEFDVVRASPLGRIIAWVCQAIGTPVVPRTGWLSPGTTHVEHIDEADGWFRFTMTVTHPFFGEVFYQTGRFHAAGGGL